MEANFANRSFAKLKTYCESENFLGWDPFDGLNSYYFQQTPLRNNKFFRLAWLQLFKRSPINLRQLFKVEKDYNPKGLGLFLTGYCNLYQIKKEKDDVERINFLINKIIELQSEGYSGSCWGYNFDWQAKAFFQPKYTPTVVATTFIAYALLDAYEILDNKDLLTVARSACDFVLNDLNRSYDEVGNFAFSYSPLDNTQIFNASLLGARLLSRVYHYTGENILIENARKAVQYCMRYQRNDGSWTYGTLPHHQWVDNFHTGYNLECLGEYSKFSNDNSFNKNINLGLKYYLSTFFTADGVSKYYNNKIYPVDIHSPAQLVVTLYRLGRMDENIQRVDKVLDWTIQNMQGRTGYFYYRKDKYFFNKIPYIRWAQAWMFYALSFRLKRIF